MRSTNPSLLTEIQAFLSETGMGASYFGKRAVGNSELVQRLRDGKRVWPETATRVRAFIKAERGGFKGNGPAPSAVQAPRRKRSQA